MRMYSKSTIKLIDGLLVNEEGHVIMPATNVINQANKLETLAQKARFLAAQPDATPMPSLNGFERKSITDTNDDIKFTVTTPMMDMKAIEAMAIMDELDDMSIADKANAMLNDFKELISWVSKDYVIDSDFYSYRFDMPTLGSILELTVDDITRVIAEVCGIEPKKDEVKEDEAKTIIAFDLSECDDCDDTDCFFNPFHESDMTVTHDEDDEDERSE